MLNYILLFNHVTVKLIEKTLQVLLKIRYNKLKQRAYPFTTWEIVCVKNEFLTIYLR